MVSGLLLLSMFLAYRVFLARENQHSYNRGVLLMIYVVAFATLPILSLFRTILAHDSQAVGLVVSGGFVQPVITSKPMWGTVVIWLYMIGMIIIVAKTLITWVNLVSVIRSGEKIVKDGYTVVLTDDERFAPFSWMRYMVISRSDYENNHSAIVAHEFKHIACRHWVDLLIAQVVCVINWFNPAAWLMREELMLVHEYQADMAVLESGFNPRDYQLLLIKKAVGVRFPSLANSLNHSKLKKRITMMCKTKSGAEQKMKALALVPMLALALGVASVPAVRAAVSTISSSDVSIGKDSEKLAQDSVSLRNFKVAQVSKVGDETAVLVAGENIVGSLTVSGATFTIKGKTFDATSMKCDMSDGDATIVARFPVAGDYSDTHMSLDVNGKIVKFDLDGYIDDNMINVVGVSSKKTSDAAGDVDSPSKDYVIYLDGEKISKAEMDKLSSDRIASVTVVKEKKIIIITTKK